MIDEKIVNPLPCKKIKHLLLIYIKIYPFKKSIKHPRIDTNINF